MTSPKRGMMESMTRNIIRLGPGLAIGVRSWGARKRPSGFSIGLWNAFVSPCRRKGGGRPRLMQGRPLEQAVDGRQMITTRENAERKTFNILVIYVYFRISLVSTVKSLHTQVKSQWARRFIHCSYSLTLILSLFIQIAFPSSTLVPSSGR